MFRLIFGSVLSIVAILWKVRSVSERVCVLFAVFSWSDLCCSGLPVPGSRLRSNESPGRVLRTYELYDQHDYWNMPELRDTQRLVHQCGWFKNSLYCSSCMADFGLVSARRWLTAARNSGREQRQVVCSIDRARGLSAIRAVLIAPFAAIGIHWKIQCLEIQLWNTHTLYQTRATRKRRTVN